MSLDFGDRSVANYMVTASTPVTGFPFTLAGWIYSDLSWTPTSSPATILGIFDDDGTPGASIQITEGTLGTVRARCTGVTSTGFASSSIAATANTWHNVCGVFTGAESRMVYLDGGNSNESTSDTGALSGIDIIGIGLKADTDDNHPGDGRIAYPGIWNIALTAIEVAMLFRYAPKMVRRDALVFGRDLHEESERDEIGGLTTTTTGTLTVAPHAPIITPVRPGFVMPGTGGSSPPSPPIPPSTLELRHRSQTDRSSRGQLAA